MAFLTRSRMTEEIIRVLRKFDNYYIRNENYFSNFPFLTNKTDKNRLIINDQILMTNMLWRLNDDAIVHMCRECGALAEKYLDKKDNILGYKTMELEKMAKIDRNFYYIDVKDSKSNIVNMGWNDEAPQKICGYANEFDIKANEMIFNIHATRFDLYNGRVVLRLWKGCYMGMVGGEIGIYGKPDKIKNKDMELKVIDTIKKFAESVGQKLYIEDLKKLTPEKILNKLVNMALSDKDLKDINNKPLKDECKKRLGGWLSASTAVIKNIPQEITLIVTNAKIVKIIMIKRLINFIVGVIRIIREMQEKGEIFSNEWSPSLEREEMKNELGIEGMAIQVFWKDKDDLIAERREYDSGYWATVFKLFEKRGNKEYFLEEGEVKNQIYTVNHFYFVNEGFATRFCESIIRKIEDAMMYERNKSNGKHEKISFKMPNNKTVNIFYGI